jgi:Putative MetA-pathway of phenol degradation
LVKADQKIVPSVVPVTRSARARSIVAIVFLLLSATSADAQQTVTDIIGFLMLNTAVPTADFERDQAAADAARQTIVSALLVNLGSVPLSTSSSGFLYRFNEQLGSAERAADTFGPFFVERALTPGRGHPSLGMTASTSAFRQLAGEDLRDGTFVTIANRFRDEPAPFDTESLTMRMRSSTMTLFGSVPITDRFEVGVAVPLVRLSLDGERINVYRGSRLVQARASAVASGIGDLAVRGKVLLVNNEAGGFAAAAEVRLPTGDSDNLLGAGSSQWRLAAIGSYEPPRFGVHVNVGLVRGGVSNEATFAIAALAALHPRFSVSGELLGRHASDLHGLTLFSAPHPTITGVETFRLLPLTDATSTLHAVGGVKWNVAGKLVVAGHVRVPLTDGGLTARVIPTVALEYAF